MMTSIIKTATGLGSPGYTDDRAPNGGQWQINGVHTKVPEGTSIAKTGEINYNAPGYWEVQILSGEYSGICVWVKSTHVIDVEPEAPPIVETPPSVETGDDAWLLVLGSYVNALTGQEYLKVRKVSKPEGGL